MRELNDGQAEVALERAAGIAVGEREVVERGDLAGITPEVILIRPDRPVPLLPAECVSCHQELAVDVWQAIEVGHRPPVRVGRPSRLRNRIIDLGERQVCAGERGVERDGLP